MASGHAEGAGLPCLDFQRLRALHEQLVEGVAAALQGVPTAFLTPGGETTDVPRDLRRMERGAVCLVEHRNTIASPPHQRSGAAVDHKNGREPDLEPGHVFDRSLIGL